MSDDDFEDYQAIFFQECAELLGALQEQLDALAEGTGDTDTVNAAFRAVHSVKGGAAAFGFDRLIAFAHVFETVMDKVRSDALALDHDVSAVLVRAGDVMQALVEEARDGVPAPEETAAKVGAELAELAGLEPPAAAAAAKPAEEPEEEDIGDDVAEREVVLLFELRDGFLSAGHDPLKVIRAARAMGLTGAEAMGEPAPLEEFDPLVCPLSWRLRFETSASIEEIMDFFMIYDEFAQISIDSDASDGEDDDSIDVNETDEGAPDTEEASGAAAAPAAPGDGPAAAGGEGGGGEAPVQNARAASRMSKTLRVELPRIDRLVNLVGEIVITQAVLAQKLSEVDASGGLELGHAVESMSRQTRELQESVMAIRAQPVKSVFSRMPRVVRDLADKLGKEAKIILSGEHTEVDTTVIEELAEPLTHMLRNSMDHGLETTSEDRVAVGKDPVGVIRLSAEHRGERVIISVEDDGRGINREVVLRKSIEKGLVAPEENLTPEEIDMLIFHPGFSTAATVSSVSGRGVGMDVVKKKIQALGGRCTVRNRPGEGAAFLITLPLTLAVLDGMTVCVGDERFILPLSSVVEAMRVDAATIEVLPAGGRVLSTRGAYMPLVSLRDALNVSGEGRSEEMAIVVDTETNGHVALLVDELIGQRQVVLKSLEQNFKRVDGVSGATILGDGRVALILDIPGLLSLGGQDQAPALMEVF